MFRVPCSSWHPRVIGSSVSGACNPVMACPIRTPNTGTATLYVLRPPVLKCGWYRVPVTYYPLLGVGQRAVPRDIWARWSAQSGANHVQGSPRIASYRASRTLPLSLSPPATEHPPKNKAHWVSTGGDGQHVDGCTHTPRSAACTCPCGARPWARRPARPSTG